MDYLTIITALTLLVGGLSGLWHVSTQRKKDKGEAAKHLTASAKSLAESFDLLQGPLNLRIIELERAVKEVAPLNDRIIQLERIVKELKELIRDLKEVVKTQAGRIDVQEEYIQLLTQELKQVRQDKLDLMKRVKQQKQQIEIHRNGDAGLF